MNVRKLVFAIAAMCCVTFLCEREVSASDGPTQYITITVEATDDSDDLQYAIGRPENFSSNNTFTIPAGSNQTIYVKDAAGNITTREYTASGVSGSSSGGNKTVVTSGSTPPGTSDQEINIDLELGMDSDKIGNGVSPSVTTPGSSSAYSDYEYLTDSVITEKAPAVVRDKVTTDGSDLAEKVFYTVQTAEGEVFYLVIEQGSSNAVHFLNTVTLDDLEAIAAEYEDDSSGGDSQEDNLLQALQAEQELEETDKKISTGKNSQNTLRIGIFILLLAGGAYYYFFIYKNKKTVMEDLDAMDMDEFVPENDDEEDDLDFDIEEKQRLLEELVASEYQSEEEELIDQNPEDYFSEDSDKAEETEEIDLEDAYQEENKKIEADESISEAFLAAQEYDDDLDGEEEDEVEFN